jgi:hypothetical protein
MAISSIAANWVKTAPLTKCIIQFNVQTTINRLLAPIPVVCFTDSTTITIQKAENRL